MEAFLSIVSSIVSILGGWWAWHEARSAKSSAETAEAVRRELVGRRSTAELARVQAELRRVLAVVAQVGPTSTQQLVRGINCAHIAREVEALASLLVEQRGHFTDLYSNRATALRDDLRSDIEGLADAKVFDEKKRYGKSIYYKLENFMPVVKQLADEQQDRPPNL